MCVSFVSLSLTPAVLLLRVGVSRRWRCCCKWLLHPTHSADLDQVRANLPLVLTVYSPPCSLSSLLTPCARAAGVGERAAARD
jgi:hypothetical protein